MKTTRRAFVRTLFAATQAAAFSRILPGNLFAAEPAPPNGGVNFLVFGDWGRKGERDQTEVAAQMAIAAKAGSARFVISVGDNFYDYGVASPQDPQWQTSFEKVYHDPALQIPWHCILGNHDYNGNCDAQIEYAQSSPRWHMPARYYSQTHQIDATASADFFYLDTSPMIKSYWHNKKQLSVHVATQDVPRQMAWFKEALAASKARWKIVMAHHPVYSGGEHGDSHDLIADILPLLRQYKVQAWFNGHDHDLQHLESDGINFFCTGAGSKVRHVKKTIYTRFAKTRSGFTTVSLQADQMFVRMTDSRGRVLYSTTVPAQPA